MPGDRVKTPDSNGTGTVLEVFEDNDGLGDGPGVDVELDRTSEVGNDVVHYLLSDLTKIAGNTPDYYVGEHVEIVSDPSFNQSDTSIPGTITKVNNNGTVDFLYNDFSGHVDTGIPMNLLRKISADSLPTMDSQINDASASDGTYSQPDTTHEYAKEIQDDPQVDTETTDFSDMPAPAKTSATFNIGDIVTCNIDRDGLTGRDPSPPSNMTSGMVSGVGELDTDPDGDIQFYFVQNSDDGKKYELADYEMTSKTASLNKNAELQSGDVVKTMVSDGPGPGGEIVGTVIEGPDADGLVDIQLHDSDDIHTGHEEDMVKISSQTYKSGDRVKDALDESREGTVSDGGSAGGQVAVDWDDGDRTWEPIDLVKSASQDEDDETEEDGKDDIPDDDGDEDDDKKESSYDPNRAALARYAALSGQGQKPDTEFSDGEIVTFAMDFGMGVTEEQVVVVSSVDDDGYLRVRYSDGQETDTHASLLKKIEQSAKRTVNSLQERWDNEGKRLADGEKNVNCSCGKTNFIDGGGQKNSDECPQCGDKNPKTGSN